jgi:hypothetical protein
MFPAQPNVTSVTVALVITKGILRSEIGADTFIIGVDVSATG